MLRLGLAALLAYAVFALVVLASAHADEPRLLPLGNGLLLDTWCEGRNRWMYDDCVVRPA